MVLNLDKYKNAKKPNAHSQPQKTDVLETSFRTKRQLFREEKLSFKDYYEGILDLYKFVPKDKHVQELEDTDSDESDEETSDDSDNDDNDEVICNFCNNNYKRRNLARHPLYCKAIQINNFTSLLS
jgi:hypothetical protein